MNPSSKPSLGALPGFHILELAKSLSPTPGSCYKAGVLLPPNKQVQNSGVAIILGGGGPAASPSAGRGAMQAMPSAELRAVAELNLAAAPVPLEVLDADAPGAGAGGRSSDDTAAALAPSHLGPDLEHVARMLSDATAPGSPSSQRGRPRLKRGRREPAGSRSASELQELANNEVPKQHTRGDMRGDARGELRLARASLRGRRRQRRRADSTDGRIQAVEAAAEPHGRAWNRPGEHSSATARARLTWGCSAALQWVQPASVPRRSLQYCWLERRNPPACEHCSSAWLSALEAAGCWPKQRHLQGYTTVLPCMQAWRCEACECWVPRAAGGETAWRAHVQGIRHRRQALSLLHTGARGNLLLSAFERLPGACVGPRTMSATSRVAACVRTASGRPEPSAWPSISCQHWKFCLIIQAASACIVLECLREVHRESCACRSAVCSSPGTLHGRTRKQRRAQKETVSRSRGMLASAESGAPAHQLVGNAAANFGLRALASAASGPPVNTPARLAQLHSAATKVRGCTWLS